MIAPILGVIGSASFVGAGWMVASIIRDELADQTFGNRANRPANDGEARVFHSGTFNGNVTENPHYLTEKTRDEL